MPSPLATVVFWAAVVCCAVAEIAIVRSAALARDGADGARDGVRLPSVRRGLEVTWAVLPALALAAVLAWTWREMRARAAPERAVPERGVPSPAPDAGRPPGAVL